MKKLLYSLIFICLAVAGANAQTVTPTSGASTQSLQAVTINTLSAINNKLAGTLTVTPSSNTLSISTSSATTSGSVTAGAFSILFETSSDFSGIIGTNRFLANGFLSFPGTTGKVYPAISYTVTTGTLFITKTN